MPIGRGGGAAPGPGVGTKETGPNHPPTHLPTYPTTHLPRPAAVHAGHHVEPSVAVHVSGVGRHVPGGGGGVENGVDLFGAQHRGVTDALAVTMEA